MPRKKKAAKKGKRSAGEPVVEKGARQNALPGMEDRAIEQLDDAALRYDEIKKARMKLTVQEVEAKREVAVLMRTRKKKHYQHGNIVIDIVPEGEKVKVKVAALGDEDEIEDVEVSSTEGAGEQPDESELEEVEEFDPEEAEEELAEVAE